MGIFCLFKTRFTNDKILTQESDVGLGLGLLSRCFQAYDSPAAQQKMQQQLGSCNHDLKIDYIWIMPCCYFPALDN
eukprot:g53165.t1